MRNKLLVTLGLLVGIFLIINNEIFFGGIIIIFTLLPGALIWAIEKDEKKIDGENCETENQCPDNEEVNKNEQD